ncbi:conserved hypothetical protein [Aspergillus terreus NIH2624]|uniref:RGS domain-containing protein n=1 Tax=Aspergillus terreus (strain NIH 2624 / FGSC A1156) TaxID=341663 RepID=Q0CDQ4_ASPTN|nr:uncharacterized protein ATEG_08180 [Aspergillus terreus NIH2624]EAU31353.1 conserved hypothetical protein [Aspergillus terreus NIH2624]
MGSEMGVTPDSKPQAVYSPVSIFWACWCAVWTTAVLCGMAFLIIRRDSPVIRVRGLWLSLAAVLFLHAYWAPVQFGVMIGPIMPGDAQYWIMGTYLPIGIALFHASNARFLHVAKLQKKYIRPGSSYDDMPAHMQRRPGLIVRFKRLDYTNKTLVVVAIAIVIQLFLTILMWLISRKWHPSWGIPGTEVHGTKMQQLSAMGAGWEWWATIVGQFIWAWIVAPIVLWKARHIQDTQGWRVQTMACVIANLPATPMWLIAVYVPGFEKVNAVWLPPQWICLSIIVMEIFTIFLPCWEVIRHQSLRKETLETIAEWEAKTKGKGSEAKSVSDATTMIDSMISGFKSTNASIDSKSSRASILTMGALEHVLERNPTPLLEFSALHDFSGENIAFLTSVAEWKSSLPKPIRDGTAAPDDPNTRELIRERFNRALQIYTEYISVRHAEFPVNISSQDLRRLEGIFDAAAQTCYGDQVEADPATPFDKFTFDPPSPRHSESSEQPIKQPASAPKYWGEVPESFNATVFDAAEESIKYLVLTNTWPKFIKNRRISADSANTLKPEEYEMA